MAQQRKRKLSTFLLSPQSRLALESITRQRTEERGKPASMTAVVEDALLAFAAQLGIRARRTA